MSWAWKVADNQAPIKINVICSLWPLLVSNQFQNSGLAEVSECCSEVAPYKSSCGSPLRTFLRRVWPTDYPPGAAQLANQPKLGRSQGYYFVLQKQSLSQVCTVQFVPGSCVSSHFCILCADGSHTPPQKYAPFRTAGEDGGKACQLHGHHAEGAR